MVPKGWNSWILSDICRKQISYGIVQTGDNLPNGIPCLRVVDLTRDVMRLEDMIKTSEETNKAYRKTILEKDEIVMALRGEIGLARLIDDNLVGANITRGLARISPETKVVLPEFLLWELRSPQFRADLIRRVGGSALQEISLTELRKVRTLLPPLLEQKKIAQILSTWDKAISVTEKLLTNSQRQKKALMQQLLTGKKRLLDENGTRFSETWKLYALSKLFQRVTTKNNGKSNNVVTISGQHGLIKQEDFFKKTVASDTLDGYFLLKKGQFAYNKSYSNGYPMGAIKRLNRYPEGVVTTLYICFELTTPKKSCGDYWEHYFESGLLNNSLSQIAHEGGRAHGLLNVKPSDFFSLKVAVPGFEEQQKIASVLSAADTEISTLEKKLACLKDEKKALMQQLLTGKRRVKVDEAVAV
ncbi:restriction endonuclease subunit S [Escherichia coli]|uniref:restriction endonuclease subunit S n=2 Tax=Escherichia coli TaxID=562 RepID=UPI0002DE917D|nr:restriction endonuclease subunit S [Escherichia coli]AKF20906.1 restriction endonuclease subunit S [Escherichia coli]APL03569.1 restriction endonuclease subunit S [Escherichia coli]APL13354.1 restriction endonuclease subunit S [Escherichia coli]APL22404.1 restriction endonuclease subunit S [Escherichia coli]APL28177.1 restriction endonuclease subunit S [Escherichia coli]